MNEVDFVYTKLLNSIFCNPHTISILAKEWLETRWTTATAKPVAVDTAAAASVSTPSVDADGDAVMSTDQNLTLLMRPVVNRREHIRTKKKAKHKRKKKREADAALIMSGKIRTFGLLPTDLIESTECPFCNLFYRVLTLIPKFRVISNRIYLFDDMFFAARSGALSAPALRICLILFKRQDYIFGIRSYWSFHNVLEADNLQQKTISFDIRYRILVQIHSIVLGMFLRRLSSDFEDPTTRQNALRNYERSLLYFLDNIEKLLVKIQTLELSDSVLPKVYANEKERIKILYALSVLCENIHETTTGLAAKRI